jgi:CubicO group peptidase (beta-lactamase class C family)
MSIAFNSMAAPIARRFAWVVALLALCANKSVTAGAADAPAPAPEKLQLITSFFDNEIATGKLPGAVVLIQQHGRPVYLRCFGVRDVTTKLPMTPDTIFALHSMTKPITSLAAMMLIDARKIGLDDPVSKYIPSFAEMKVGMEQTERQAQTALKLVPAKRQVTVMDLLRHTSGLSYDYIGAEWVMEVYSQAHLFDGHFNNSEFAERVAKVPLVAQPGTLWRYSHSTDVLGRVIEIVSGETLYQFERQHIFDPLGMTHTKFTLDTPEERALMAEPLPDDVVLVKAERERRAHPEWESGGGGLVSTIVDYAHFAQMILGRGQLDGTRYLSPAAFKDMTADHIGPGAAVARDYFYFPGDGFGFGYGLAVNSNGTQAAAPTSVSIRASI